MRQLFRYAQDRKLSEFDLTRGGETYKDRFATHIRENLTVHFNHDLGPRHYIQMSVQRADGGIRKGLETLRKYPAAYGLARNVARSGLNWYRRERRRKQCEGARYAAGVIRRAFQNCIFAGEATVTFPIGKQEVKFFASSPGGGMSVRPAALSELAVVSAMNPGLSPSLSEFQNRLAAGHLAYLIRLGSEPVQIWCVSSQSTPVGDKDSCSRAPTLVLEQCWTAPWFRGGGLFRGILQQVSDRDMDVLVSCRERDQITREMHSLGFQALRKTMRFCFFHWFRPVLTFRSGLAKVSYAKEDHGVLASYPEDRVPAEVEVESEVA
jgi:hypothetical protein